MKLTELKNKIDEALRLHNDYDFKIIIDDEEIDEMECGIDVDRFNFNIYVDSSGCEEYHIEDDNDMEYCSICEMYYSSGKDCPGCKLKELRKRLKLM